MVFVQNNAEASEFTLSPDCNFPTTFFQATFLDKTRKSVEK
jgi:hypothetical protein